MAWKLLGYGFLSYIFLSYIYIYPLQNPFITPISKHLSKNGTTNILDPCILLKNSLSQSEATWTIWNCSLTGFQLTVTGLNTVTYIYYLSSHNPYLVPLFTYIYGQTLTLLPSPQYQYLAISQ